MLQPLLDQLPKELQQLIIGMTGNRTQRRVAQVSQGLNANTQAVRNRQGLGTTAQYTNVLRNLSGQARHHIQQSQDPTLSPAQQLFHQNIAQSHIQTIANLDTD